MKRKIVGIRWAVVAAMVATLALVPGTAHAAVVAFRAAATTTDASGTVTSKLFAAPGAAVAGDELVASLVYKTQNLSDIANTAPAGWAKVPGEVVDCGATTTCAHLVVATKPAAGGAETATWSFAAAPAGLVLTVGDYQGVDTASPWDKTGYKIEAGGSGTTVHTAPAFTPTVADTLGVAVFGTRASETWTPGAGLVERSDVQAAPSAQASLETDSSAAALTAGTNYAYSATEPLGTSVAVSFAGNLKPAPGVPAPVANFSYAPSSGTTPLTVNFTDTSTNTPTSWAWTFGDGGTSTAQNPSHVYSAAGAYDVSLTATNAGGSNTKTVTAAVTATVPAPVANFTASPTSGTTPLAVQFTDSSTNSPTSWSWTFGDGGTSTAQNPSHTYTAAGTYDVAVTATNAGGSNTKTVTGMIVASAPSNPVPTVPPGTNVPTNMVFADEFNGTTPDTSKWDLHWFCEGCEQNNVGTYAANVSEGGGVLKLQLSTINGVVTGASVHTAYTAGRYQLPVGGFVEARVMFPGTTGQDIYNWPAWWVSGQNWPNAGEHDIAEGLGGDLTINYHSPSINQQYPVSPTCCWGSSFHIFGLYRGAGFADVYWDGVRQAHYTTADNGGVEELIFTAGKSNSRTPILGDAGAVQVDYVRAWQ